MLVDSDIRGTTIPDCGVYGVSAWGLVRDTQTCQRNLRVSKEDDSPFYVDDIEVAQFIYLIVHNPRIRDVIDTISEKGVLILGRFTPERKAVLDGIRTRLCDKGYVPMIFDFEKTTQRDFAETVKVLAGLSLFVIVDLTNPSFCPLELQATVPDYMLPFVPIIERGEKPFAMFAGLQSKYDSVLDTLVFPSANALVRDLDQAVIDPALAMEEMIRKKRARPRPVRTIPECAVARPPAKPRHRRPGRGSGPFPYPAGGRHRGWSRRAQQEQRVARRPEKSLPQHILLHRRRQTAAAADRVDPLKMVAVNTRSSKLARLAR